MNKPEFTQLKILRVSLIAAYGHREVFDDLDEAIEYVETINEIVTDPQTPLDNFSVLVEYENGDDERCSFRDRDRTLSWLKRFAS
ncbi:MAG: hypothetical protein AAF870_06595 [Pseudomonadota bacterium]